MRSTKGHLDLMNINCFGDLVNLNFLLVSSITGWALAQIIKTFIHLIMARRFVAERLVGGGGMPSSHSATVCALTTATYLQYGYNSFEFAIATVFALVVMYDAIGVRQETGKQSIFLNEIRQVISDMGSNLKSPEDKLREFIGHTPLQVLMGGILGILISLFYYFTFCGNA